MNLYVYCYNDPIQFIDPTGHWGGVEGEQDDSKLSVEDQQKIIEATDAYNSTDDEKVKKLCNLYANIVREKANDIYLADNKTDSGKVTGQDNNNDLTRAIDKQMETNKSKEGRSYLTADEWNNIRTVTNRNIQENIEDIDSYNDSAETIVNESLSTEQQDEKILNQNDSLVLPGSLLPEMSVPSVPGVPKSPILVLEFFYILFKEENVIHTGSNEMKYLLEYYKDDKQGLEEFIDSDSLIGDNSNATHTLVVIDESGAIIAEVPANPGSINNNLLPTMVNDLGWSYEFIPLNEDNENQVLENPLPQDGDIQDQILDNPLPEGNETNVHVNPLPEAGSIDEQIVDDPLPDEDSIIYQDTLYNEMLDEGTDNDERIFNVNKQESDVYNGFEKVRGRDRRTSGSGKKQRYYEWDHTHNDIEVYDSKGRHLGSMDPTTGEMYKDAVPGRKIDF